MLSQECWTSQSALLIVRLGRLHPAFILMGTSGPAPCLSRFPAPLQGQAFWVLWSSYWMVTSLPEQLVAWGPLLAPSHSQQMESGTGGCFCCLGLACRPASAAKGFPGQGSGGFPSPRSYPFSVENRSAPGRGSNHIPRREQSLSCPTPLSGSNRKIVGERTGSWLDHLGCCLLCHCSGRWCSVALSQGDNRDIKGLGAKGHLSAWDFMSQLKH